MENEIQNGAEVASKVLELVSEGKDKEARAIIQKLTAEQQSECCEGMVREWAVSRKDAEAVLKFLLKAEGR